MKNILLTIAVTIFTSYSFAQSITNINAAQRTDGSMIFDIYYDLNGLEPTYNITCEVSFNGGASYTPITNVSGDEGLGISIGTSKYIVWNFGAEFPAQFSNQTLIKIIATAIVPWSCGLILSVNHAAGNVAPVNKEVNYGTVLSNLTGSNKCWITQNLGSDHQAASALDATEASAGWYWQFNKKQGYKHDGTTRTPNTTWITSISENSAWLPANDPCTLLLGTGWRLPTATEWTNADANGAWNGIYQTYASVLKLHAAGGIDGTTGSISYRGSRGYIWSNVQWNITLGRALYIDFANTQVSSIGKVYGFSSRCLKD